MHHEFTRRPRERYDGTGKGEVAIQSTDNAILLEQLMECQSRRERSHVYFKRCVDLHEGVGLVPENNRSFRDSPDNSVAESVENMVHALVSLTLLLRGLRQGS